MQYCVADTDSPKGHSEADSILEGSAKHWAKSLVKTYRFCRAVAISSLDRLHLIF